MTRRQKLAVGVTALFVVGIVLLWMAPGRQRSLAQSSVQSPAPLMARGFTDAPAGTVVVFGMGSDRLLELRVVEGQKVKRGEIIAVLSNYPAADISVRSAEAELEQVKLQHESLVAGIRATQKPNRQIEGANNGDDNGKVKVKASDTPKVGIAEQEAVVKLSAEQNKLKELEMQRSSLPAQQKQLEISVSEQKLERDRAQLRVLKETLASDLAQSEADIRIKTAKLENAQAMRERGLVRSPLDGIVVQIWTRPGERIERGIAQIVDMGQLRVLADIDEVLVGRIAPGGRVNVIFHGENIVHEGKIVHIAATVKRMLSMGSLGSGTTNVNVVQVEVALDDPSQMPQMLGREAQVTFLHSR
jgi:HlyD family secretion protein